jgi:VCBS repeat-containing protein
VASDPENDDLTIWGEVPAGLTLTETTCDGAGTCTAYLLDPVEATGDQIPGQGNHYFTLNVTDSNGPAPSKEFLVKVNEVPVWLDGAGNRVKDDPIVSPSNPPIEITSITTDPYSQRWTVQAIDPNGDPIAIFPQGDLSGSYNFGCGVPPDWMVVQDNGDGSAFLFGLFPEPGSYNFSLYVSDGIGYSDDVTYVIQHCFHLEVTSNLSPTFVAAPGDPGGNGPIVLNSRSDGTNNWDVVAADQDGDALTIEVVLMPDWLTLNDNGDGTALLSAISPVFGNHVVVLKVSDGISTPLTQKLQLRVSVTNPVDGGLGSLRDAIDSIPVGGTVSFHPDLMSGGTITLNGTPLYIEKALTIDASNLPGGLTLSGNNASRVFSIDASGRVALQGLTITGGDEVSPGGCIVNSGALWLIDSTVTGCISDQEGGGIYSDGSLAVVNSTISGNISTGLGSLLSQGGGIYSTGELSLVHTTVSDNHVQAGSIDPGAAYIGGGISASTLTIENSIIAGNTAASDNADLSVGNLIASGPNLIGDNSGVELTFPAGPLAGTAASPLDPVLAPLGNYGGSTQTMVLRSGSPAIDAAIVTGNSPATDQRGVVRPQGAANDLGATERKADDVNPDTDGDGVADAIDNCPAVSNPLQTDSNGNGDGDACDVSVPPVVEAGPGGIVDEADLFSSAGTVTDSDSGNWTASVDYGDGSGAQTLLINSAGSFALAHTYVDNGNYTITVNVADDQGNVGAGTASVTVNNVPPIALNDTFSTDEDTGLTIPASGVLANDSDAGADSLTAKMTTGASNGSVALNPDGSFTYTPNENFNVVDSFVYVANDGDADSTNATVSITVNPVNDAPVTTDDAYSVDEDTILTIPAPGMLVNDTDVDGDTVMLETFNSPNHGTLSIGGDGAFSYTPNPDFNGVDTFGYVATDLQGGTDNGTVTITVLPVNDAPEAVNDNAITNEEFPAMISVMANDSDLDGDAISITSSTNGTYGTTTTDGSSVTYTPIANFHGIDNYSYEICDNGVPQRCDVAMVSVTVLSVNDMPAAFDDSATTNEDTTITIDVLVNDSDLDGDSIAVSGSTDGTHGTTTTDGSAVSYKPELNFNGNDSFSYTMCDNGTPQLCNKATVSVTVNPVNDSPTVSADPAPASAQYSDPLSVTISGDDVDSTALSIVTSTLPAGLSLSAANCAVGSPPVDCEWTISGNVEASPGVYSVTATVTDNGEATDATPQSTSTTFEITVDPEDARATYTGPLFLGSAEDGSFTVNLKATIRDVTAVDAANDPNAGDIRKVSVEFVNAAGASLCKPPSVSLVFNGDETVGSASCSYSGRLGDNEEELPLEVTTVVNGHYVDNSDNEVVVFVVRPGEGKITGGGQLEMINSAGVYAADPVLPTNYGFGAQTVTTGKNNIQYRGRVTVIVRAADGHKYKIKSNAVLSLGVNLDPDGDGDVTTVPHYAEFESKANLADVTDPLNPVALGGNLLLQLRMTDNGEPGELDSISLTLWDGGTLLFSSNWDGSRSVEQNVARGNLKVQ